MEHVQSEAAGSTATCAGTAPASHNSARVLVLEQERLLANAESSRGFVAECTSGVDNSLEAKVQTVQLMTAVASQLHLSEQDGSAQDLALY
eukprot:s1288_g11.t1